MASAPTPRLLRASDFGDSLPNGVGALLDAFNQFQQETINALAGRLTLGDNIAAGFKEKLPFTSPASGNATLKIEWRTASAPRLANVGWLERVDGGELTAAWSATFALVDGGDSARLGLIGGYLVVSFQGLPASTQFRASVWWL